MQSEVVEICLDFRVLQLDSRLWPGVLAIEQWSDQAGKETDQGERRCHFVDDFWTRKTRVKRFATFSSAVLFPLSVRLSGREPCGVLLR